MMNRVIGDPQSKQKASVAGPVIKAEAVDKFTVKFITDKPAAPLLGFVCDRLIITSKAAFDKYGRDSADKEHLMGGGPHRLKNSHCRPAIGDRQGPDSGGEKESPCAGRNSLPCDARNRAAGHGSIERRNPDRPVHPAPSAPAG